MERFEKSEKYEDKCKCKCMFIYKDNLFTLRKEFTSYNIIDKKEEKLELTFIEFENIEDKSYMFEGCELLEGFGKSYKIKTESVNEIKEEVEERYKNQNSEESIDMYKNIKICDQQEQRVIFIHQRKVNYSKEIFYQLLILIYPIWGVLFL